MRTPRWWRIAVVLVFSLVAAGQEALQQPAGPAPNSDPVYLQLRKLGLGTEAISVNNVILKRDAGTFTFASGSICFATPVQGKVTAAVFTGSGSFALKPPTAVEQRQLGILTNNQPFAEEFNELVLRFTDDTYEQLKKANGATAGGGPCPADMLSDNAGTLQHNLHYNLSARILQDVLAPEPGGLFVAFIKGKKYSSKMVYVMDPHGAPPLNPDAAPELDVAPEEVALMTWEDMKFGVWAAFHLAEEYPRGQATSTQQNGWIDIEKHAIDAALERNARLSAKSVTTLVSRVNGLRVVPFDLFPTLRVQSVSDGSGRPLAFIQEDKEADPQFFVILPQPLAAGERLVVTTSYAGKEAVSNEGDGNYYPVARHNWYPNSRFDDYATYEMRFTVPKGLTMIATGTPLDEVTEGNQTVSRWRSEQPQTVAGFQFGRLKKMEAKLAGDFVVESYANTEIPDFIKDVQTRTTMLNSLNTTGLVSKALAEGQLAVPLYTDYFGPTPFKRLAIAQQTAMTYGQSWPELVWLPMSYFLDSTYRHQLGLDDPRGYFKAVASHEVAHQWWGHTVTFGSYRDQWISEGFADMSASLFIQVIQKKPQEFIKYWDDERDLLLEKTHEGFRPIDVGPVTMGARTITGKTGNIYNRLIYAKGGYILHMIRMLMWDPKTADSRFKELMQDFVKTYTGRAATTEDFKAMVEKHITPAMDLDHNRRMDWFFNQYVYGTALPHYRMDHAFNRGADGNVELSFKITQSGVDGSFAMMVPVYLELADGRVTRLGLALLSGNTSVEKKIPLGALKDVPKRAMLNYYDDVLAVIDK
jgi:hypothetical protein